MQSFEEARRKAKLSAEDFAAIQQPIDKRTGKKNPFFDRIYKSKNDIKKEIADKEADREMGEALNNRERENFNKKEKRLHPKYL